MVRLAIDMITITIEYSFAVDHVIRAKTFGARMTGLAGGKIYYKHDGVTNSFCVPPELIPPF